MAFRPRSALFLTLAALLAACGGRSQLRDSSGSGPGSGGSGPASSSASTSTGGGMGGSGGSGGAGGSGGTGGTVTMGCVVDGAPIELAGIEGYRLIRPILVDAGNGTTATLVASWTGGTDPNNLSHELRHTTFAPWGAWPADGTVGPSYLADYDAGDIFAATRSQGGFGIFFSNPPKSPGLPSTVDYLSPLVPGSGTIPPVVQQSPTYSDPLFVTQGEQPSAHLFGFVNNAAPHAALTLVLQDDKTSAKKLFTNLGCSQGGVLADAARVAGGYLVAYSSGTAVADPACNQAGSTVGQGLQLMLLRVNEDGTAAPAIVFDSVSSGLVSRVQVVPRSDGAWIVWTHDGGNAPALAVARVDPQGAILAGPFAYPLFGDPHWISATSLGDHLALAVPSPAQVLATHVQVQVLRDDGFAVAETQLDAGATVEGRTALLGSPSKKSLLVSWMQLAGEEGRRVRMARLGCVLP